MTELIVTEAKKIALAMKYTRDEFKGTLFNPDEPLGIRIRLPCGNMLDIKQRRDIPLQDMPCPCGNPEHWLVKWPEAKRE